MLVLKITGIEKAKRTLLDLELAVAARGRLPVLMNRIGRALRDDARRTITTQGDGKWEPLGKWARAKTARRKSFVQERERISFKTITVGSNGAATIVYYDQRGSWKLTDHAEGFTVLPHGKFVTLQLKDGRPLGLPPGTSKFTFRSKNPSVVPARRVFADRLRAEALLAPIIEQWLAELKQRAKT